MWDPLWNWTALLSSSGTQQRSNVTPRCSGVKMVIPSITTHFPRWTHHHGDLKLLNISLAKVNNVPVFRPVLNLLSNYIRSPGANQLMVNSFLVITLRELEDFGLYSCTVRNISADFSLKNLGKKKQTSFSNRSWGYSGYIMGLFSIFKHIL